MSDLSQVASAQDAKIKVISTLEKVAKQENYGDCEILIRPLIGDGGNFTTMLFYATIKSKEKEDLQLFVKFANVTEQIRTFMGGTEMFRREHFVFTDLVNIYEGLQKKHKVPEEEKYKFPKCYSSDTTLMEETFVLENLTSQNFSIPDRFEPMTWNFASAAVTELAKFHALSMAFEAEYPDEFEQKVKSKPETVFKAQQMREDRADSQFARVKNMVLSAVDECYKKPLNNFLNKYSVEKWMAQFSQQRRSVLTHGDYRISNILVKYEEGELVDLIPVDFQTIHYGSPINDLLYFEFTGSDSEFRENHHKALLHCYHEALGRHLHALGKNVKELYPVQDFLKDVEDRILFGFYISIMVLPFITMTANEIPDLSSDVSLEKFEVFPNSTFRKRFNGILSDYIKWGYV